MGSNALVVCRQPAEPLTADAAGTGEGAGPSVRPKQQGKLGELQSDQTAPVSQHSFYQKISNEKWGNPSMGCKGTRENMKRRRRDEFRQ